MRDKLGPPINPPAHEALLLWGARRMIRLMSILQLQMACLQQNPRGLEGFDGVKYEG